MDNKTINRVIELIKDGFAFFADPDNEDGELDLTEVSEDITQILRDDLNLPIPDGFEVESIRFRVKP